MNHTDADMDSHDNTTADNIADTSFEDGIVLELHLFDEELESEESSAAEDNSKDTESDQTGNGEKSEDSDVDEDHPNSADLCNIVTRKVDSIIHGNKHADIDGDNNAEDVEICIADGFHVNKRTNFTPSITELTTDTDDDSAGTEQDIYEESDSADDVMPSVTANWGVDTLFLPAYDATHNYPIDDKFQAHGKVANMLKDSEAIQCIDQMRIVDTEGADDNVQDDVFVPTNCGQIKEGIS